MLAGCTNEEGERDEVQGQEKVRVSRRGWRLDVERAGVGAKVVYGRPGAGGMRCMVMVRAPLSRRKGRRLEEVAVQGSGTRRSGWVRDDGDDDGSWWCQVK